MQRVHGVKSKIPVIIITLKIDVKQDVSKNILCQVKS